MMLKTIKIYFFKKKIKNKNKNKQTNYNNLLVTCSKNAYFTFSQCFFNFLLILNVFIRDHDNMHYMRSN